MFDLFRSDKRSREGRTQYVRLKSMVKDLQSLEKELLPGGRGGGSSSSSQQPALTSAELKSLDEFQRGKLELASLLDGLRRDVDAVRELRKTRSRDQRVIEAELSNAQELSRAQQLFLELKALLAKSAKKAAISAEELEHRKSVLGLMGQQIMQLQIQNSNVEMPAGYERDLAAIEEQRKRRAMRQQMRKERAPPAAAAAAAGASASTSSVTASAHARAHADGSSVAIAIADERPEVDSKISPQLQQFFKDKIQNDEKIGKMLDEIYRELVELEHIAVAIGTSLEAGNEALDELGSHMEVTSENLGGASKRLKSFVKSNTGGASFWCPLVVAGVVLLAIVGFIISIL